MNKIKKLLVFISAFVMLIVVICFGVTATDDVCPNTPDGEHNLYISDRTEVPCASTAWRYEVCSACRVGRTVIGPMVEHEFDDFYVIDAPTCYDEGKGYWYCVDCGEYDEDNGKEIITIPALEHIWISHTSSCYDFLEYVCKRCDSVKIEKTLIRVRIIGVHIV